MKVVFINNTNNDKANDLKLKIKTNLISFNKKLKEDRIILYNKYYSNCDYDIYIIFSNNIDDLKASILNLKPNANIIIITDNLSSSYILDCIKVTPNVCYSKNDPIYLIQKIYSVGIISKMEV